MDRTNAPGCNARPSMTPRREVLRADESLANHVVRREPPR